MRSDKRYRWEIRLEPLSKYSLTNVAKFRVWHDDVLIDEGWHVCPRWAKQDMKRAIRQHKKYGVPGVIDRGVA